MRAALSIGLATSFLVLVPVSGQTVTTLGGTGTSPSRAANGKGNAMRIDASVVLLDFEMYLDVPGTETLTFYMYRHHSTSGTFNLVNTWNVAVNGTGVGPAWYSSGPIVTPLLCGNSYILGVSWPGTVTYHYVTSSCGTTFALGSWLSGSTISHPPPSTEGVGCDIAQYNQRLTTIPMTSVQCVGTGCSSSGATAPRLLPATPPALGTTLTLEVVDGSASAPAVMAFSFAPTLANPVPVFGCSGWLDLTGPIATSILVLSGAGEGSVQIPVPNNPSYTGFPLSSQAGVLGTGVDVTNAVGLTVF